MTRIDTPWGPWEAAPLEELVAPLRRDRLAVRRLLTGWDVHAAIRPGAPWRFQLMLDESAEDEWTHRRDPRIRRPLTTLTIMRDDLRHLALEVRLLHKSTAPRPTPGSFACATAPTPDARPGGRQTSAEGPLM
ncbi:hypothetical protein AB0C33_30540 [Nonomuraea sp. NPDC048881]|uniref:hypothetical protein n=1 Tax=Nonomuraea sp. NPDC048881 TaxID=3155030 RepID=UPI0033CE6D4D